MINKDQPIDLSRAEYDILRVLWKRYPLSVREVHEELLKTSGWAYTTTKTMMDRMVAKELLGRESFHGVFVYKPLITRPAGLARMVEFFANRVLEIDVGTVVSMFAKSQSLSPNEIKELNRLLESEYHEKADN
jgi:BlaI family transcriptional regulator, penicillinase repressor